MALRTWVLGLCCGALLISCSDAGAGQPPAGFKPGLTWSESFAATPVEMNVAPDGSVVVRIAHAPWLVKHDTTGSAHALTPEADLEWASAFAIAADGSLYLGGTVPLDGDTQNSNVRIDHLSATAKTLSSRQWLLPGVQSSALLSLTRGPSGEVHALSSSDSGVAVVRLADNGDAAEVAAVPLPLDKQASDLAQPARLALSADGSYLLQGGSSMLWVERADASGQASAAWFYRLADNPEQAAVYAGGIVPTAQGGWFAAVGTGFQAASGPSFYHRGVVRLSEDGRRLWGAGDYFEPGTSADGAALRRVSLALLDDSILLTVAVANAEPKNSDDITLSPEHKNATLIRYSLKGDYAQAFELGAIQAAAAIGAEAAVFLETDPTQPDRYTLQRFDFAPLVVPKVAAGAACSANQDCESGACCASSTGLFAVTCAEAGHCGQGDYCNDSALCSGSCVVNSNAALQGFCSATCTASSDCPARSACVSGQCLPSCVSAADCPYRGTQCADATSNEAETVSVCSGP